MTNNKKSFKDIGIELCRTEGGIRSRVNLIILRLSSDGDSEKVIKEKTGLMFKYICRVVRDNI